MKKHKYYYFWPVCFLIWTVATFASAADEMITVTLKEGQSLRDLAKDYYGNSDLWVELLKNNQLVLKNITSGTQLRIPATQGIGLSQIKEAMTWFHKATDIGAYKDLKSGIKEAEESLDKAKKFYVEGKFGRAYEEAVNSSKLAESAYNFILKSLKNKSEAIITQLSGDVEIKQKKELLWQSAKENQGLNSMDKVRTLEASQAVIEFRDRSKLKMNANSLTVIQSVTDTQERERTSVVLLSGDLSLKFSNLAQETKLVVSTPSTNVKFTGTDFYVSVDKDSTTRFAAFEGEAVLENEFGQVNVPKNFGTKVRKNEAPLAPRPLLSPPDLISPALGEIISTGRNVQLSWMPVESSVYYKLQIDKTPDFSLKPQTVMLKGEASYLLENLGNSTFFWRVSSVDADSIPGAYSKPFVFSVDYDVTPPVLQLHSPADNLLVSKKQLIIKGLTEAGCKVSVNDREINTDLDGNFSYQYPLNEGENYLQIRSRDSHDNMAHIDRTIYLDTTPPFLNLPNFPKITNQSQVFISGQTEPFCQVKVNGGNVPVDKNGNFSFPLKLNRGQNRILFDLLDSVNLSTRVTYWVELDDIPPVIMIDRSRIVSPTRSERVAISGRIIAADNVMIDGLPVTISQSFFEYAASLNEGLNQIIITAQDSLGNSAVDSVAVFLDTMPPAFSYARISPERVKAGGNVTIIVPVAVDGGSRVLSTAPYQIHCQNGYQYQGILKFYPGSNQYQDVINLPVNVSGNIYLDQIQLTDELGNTKIYEF